MTVLKHFVPCLISILLLVACGEKKASEYQIAGEENVSQVVRSGPSISLGSTRYPQCSRIAVRYSGLTKSSNAKGYWIGLAEVGAPDNQDLKRFKYLPINTESGDIELATHSLRTQRTYEVRLYDDWEATRSWNILAKKNVLITSNPGCASPSMSIVNQDTWRADGFVRINYQGFFISSSNWIAIGEAGSPVHLNVNFRWAAIDMSSGVVEIPTSALVNNKDYLIRAYFDWNDQVNWIPAVQMPLP